MQMASLNCLKEWFDSYARAFLTGNPQLDSPLTLKIEHTARVCENIRQLARTIGLGEEKVRLAEAIGLFHDVGRFEQYRRYHTFNDQQSINHATAGIDVLTQANILDPLPDEEKTIIVDAVRFHNAPALPEGDPSDSQVFMRLIRDADKLDIWKVFADYYRHHAPHNPTVVQHLVDLPTWEPKIVEAIMQHCTARFKDMKSINDFKLLQLSWVFGLHFPATAVLARKRGDLETIASTLPADDAIQQAISTVMARLAKAAP
jgi:putative nucleotidyltransferase with HDIG domain